MSVERTAKFATANNTWENLGVKMAADADVRGFGLNWEDVSFHVLEASTNSVLVALSNSDAAPASDNAANTVVAGTFRGYSKVDFKRCWVKSPAGVSAIEFSGKPA